MQKVFTCYITNHIKLFLFLIHNINTIIQRQLVIGDVLGVNKMYVCVCVFVCVCVCVFVCMVCFGWFFSTVMAFVNVIPSYDDLGTLFFFRSFVIKNSWSILKR